MKAAALTAPGRVETIRIPTPGYGRHDVLVRMTAVGLCGTDLAVVGGARPAPRLPWVLGHEGIGEIAAVGSAVRHLFEGETVAIEPNYCCGRCAQCAAGFTSGCTKRVAVGLDTPGVLAEYVSVPAEFVHAATREVDPRDLVCAEPLAVARTAVHRSGVRAGETSLVVGAGSQGLLVCLCLIDAGITPYVREPHEGRRALAVSLGAVPAEVTSGAPGEGSDTGAPPADHVFETAGVAEAAAWALRHAAPGGTVTFIGMSGAPLELTAHELVRRQLSLKGSLIYDHPRDFAETVALIEKGTLAPHRVLRAEFGLADAAAAFDAVGSTPGKCWINLAGTGGTG
ncbi:alcohol dehydrogenase catalytic domain-containing protein [Streptomyces bathyalis]|uniref:2-deoxy-scyllo-inosamine dehydrogenase n=1 Tax=Streptomyces bathyalis TaxID=2710756 RepID=A0A7T1T7Y9_9ACTN|nr:alcohol dehydrogenase catalytic domain-containing protein [Streptomyces bathyalis]QPP08056.1 alcohol dehydrogenase catalytic domain-containing protein [Streptomyces bathyalis]